jgi:hypothetical protein
MSVPSGMAGICGLTTFLQNSAYVFAVRFLPGLMFFNSLK